MFYTMKEKILDAAAQLIWARGFNGTGVQAILAKAGASTGSFYHFFPAKDDLLVGVLRRYRELLDPMIFRPAFAATRDPIERVFSVLNVYRHHLTRNDCALGCPIGNLAGELSDTSDAFREEISNLFETWTSHILECLTEARGRFPEGLDLQELACLVLTVMEGAIMQARAGRSIEPFDASVSQLRNYFSLLVQEKK